MITYFVAKKFVLMHKTLHANSVCKMVGFDCNIKMNTNTVATNKTFLSCLMPLFQSEAKCKAIDVNMIF